jgi:GNAT superfamily N-acetyltransferase
VSTGSFEMIIDPNSIGIRPAVPRDRNRLHAMQAMSMRLLGRAFYTPEEIEAFLTYVGTMDDCLLDERTYYVAEDSAGHIIASGGWSRLRANYVDSTHTVVHSGHVTPKVRSFFVHPDWARHGIARRLMRRTEADIRAEGFGEIEVNATLSGVPFYTRLCYEPVRRLEIALPEGITFTGAVMHRRFAEDCAASTAMAVGQN